MSRTNNNPIDVRSSRATLLAGGHIANTDNPHNVDKNDVGLGNVDNTSDLDKPLSTAAQTALDTKLEAADITTKLDKNGFTGSVTVVDSVDFVAETVTTKTISYVDGQITGIA